MLRDGNRLFAGIAALILAVCLVGGGAVISEQLMQKRRADVLTERADESSTAWMKENSVAFDGKTYQFDHRIESFLFVGTDASGNEEGDETDYYGTMADYLLLMVLDYTDDSYGCIQINRNTVTAVDELNADGDVIATRNLQIFTSHWYGVNKEMSAENTVNAVCRLLGGLGRINGYYILNMKDIQLMNHAVGGVTLTMQEDHTDIDPAMVKGATLNLTDDQAHAFVRARMSTREGTNVARMRRQKQYMEAFFSQVAERSREDVHFATQLWEILRDGAITNLNGNAFSRIAQMLLHGKDKGILVPEGENKIGEILGDGEPHEEFYADTASLCQIMTNLYSLRPVGAASAAPEEEPVP